MANTYTWVNALKKAGYDITYDFKSTKDVYSEIKKMGLETVDFKEYCAEEFLGSVAEITAFINNKNPCLFIFHPLSSDVEKGFLFNVKDINEVMLWIDKNMHNISKYSYLITTQIVNPDCGFVGSVYSDGKGKLFCETLHLPHVCNQREITQPKGSYEQYLDRFYVDMTVDEDILAVEGVHLTEQDIRQIVHKFILRKGYFEIVKGIHINKRDIYTVGYEPGGIFNFPERIHYLGCCDIRSRLNRSLRNI